MFGDTRARWNKSQFGDLWAAIAYELRFMGWQRYRRSVGDWADAGPVSRHYFATTILLPMLEGYERRRA